MHVGSADSDTPYFDKHLTSLRFGSRQLTGPEIFSAMEDEGAHGTDFGFLVLLKRKHT
jgi:hypothetical protein